MNLRSSDEDETIREAGGAGVEIARAVRISLCGLDLRRPASFRPASVATSGYDWQAWLRDSFSGVLGKTFVEVYAAAGRMEVREALEIDRSLGGPGGVVGEDSLAAGAALFERLETARNLRVVEKMRSRIGAGEGPHFVTAFAVECAEFHLPLRVALVSYLYGEWRCGMSVLGVRGDLGVFAESCGAMVSKVVGELLSKAENPFGHAANL